MSNKFNNDCIYIILSKIKLLFFLEPKISEKNVTEISVASSLLKPIAYITHNPIVQADHHQLRFGCVMWTRASILYHR